jgi:hypothetical protein
MERHPKAQAENQQLEIREVAGFIFAAERDGNYPGGLG